MKRPRTLIGAAALLLAATWLSTGSAQAACNLGDFPCCQNCCRSCLFQVFSQLSTARPKLTLDAVTVKHEIGR